MYIPKFIIPDLRTNHAGETGAVYIYKGILTVTKDPEFISLFGKDMAKMMAAYQHSHDHVHHNDHKNAS